MGIIVGINHRVDQRRRIAQEAAELLYTEQEKEYKQAKFRAAKTLGVHVLPSNAEVAVELDRIAEEREGKTRQERLTQMRHAALQIMQTLKNYNPILVGSVWRGTAHRNSDIDIITYSQDPQKIVSLLNKNHYTITKTKVQTVTKKGKKSQSFHIYMSLLSNNQAEIVIRRPEDIDRQVKCEIYGDTVTGMTIKQLQEILEENPQQKFTPT
jgi:predicted nucleotidyltransferase